MFYDHLYTSAINKKKLISVLLDPGKLTNKLFLKTIEEATKYNVDFFLVGGSLIHEHIDKTILAIKSATNKPVYIFPGNLMQVSNKADGILLLSLISGRNPELLIGNHVSAAYMLKNSKMEIIPTGYILIENGKSTSVSYMSNTTPIPNDKPELVTATAIAGELLGLKMIYLESGSGANQPISSEIISGVKNNISIPLIVGGGISNTDQINKVCKAGADLVVIGNSIEKNIALVKPFIEAVHSF